MSEYAKPTEKDIQQAQEAAEARRIEELLALCESEQIPPSELRDGSQEILELEALFGSYEAKHPIAELFSIIDLTPKEADLHTTRQSAKADLKPIEALLKKIKTETTTSEEKLQELQARYRHLSRAVGMINNNKVDHVM